MMAADATGNYSRLLPGDDDEAGHQLHQEDGYRLFFLTEEEQARQRHVPSCRELFGMCNFKMWCRRFKLPVLTLVGNFVCLFLVWVICDPPITAFVKHYHHGNQGQNENDNDDEREQERNDINHQLWLRFSIGSILLVATFATDGYLCLGGAGYLEQLVTQQVVAIDEDRGQHPLALVEEEGVTPPTTRQEAKTVNDNEEDNSFFVTLSRSVDKAFGCGGMTSSSFSSTNTFLVGLLFVLFSLSAWAGISTAGSFVLVQISGTNMTDMALCAAQGPLRTHYRNDPIQSTTTFGALQDAPGFGSDNIPEEVKEWIRSFPNNTGYQRDGFLSNQSSPFVEIADTNGSGSSVAFAYNYKHGVENDEHARKIGLHLLYSPSSFRKKSKGLEKDYPATTNSLPGDKSNRRRWSSDWNAMAVELFGIPLDHPHRGWCGLFDLQQPNILQDEVVCYDAPSGRVQTFAPVLEPAREHSYGKPENRFFATSTELWVAKRRHYFHDNGKVNRGEVTLSLTSHNIETMERTILVERNITWSSKDDDGLLGGRNSRRTIVLATSCDTWFQVVLWTSIPTFLLLAVYLYRMDVPSCVVPFFLGVCMLLDYLLPPTWASVVDLVMVCFCIILLIAARKPEGPQTRSTFFKYVSVEMLTWAMYTVLVNGLFWGFFAKFVTINGYFRDLFYNNTFAQLIFIPCLSLGIALIIALLLDHPTLQIIGFGFGIAALGSVGLVIAFGGIEFVVVPFLLVAVSMGCFRAAGLVEHYRLHLIVYVHRCCRSLKAYWIC